MQLYATLSRFEFVFQIVVGILAFAGLFAWSIAPEGRIFLGAALLLVVALLDFKEITGGYENDITERRLFVYVSMLDRSQKGENVDWNAVVDQHMQQEATTARHRGDGKVAALLLGAKYLAWVILGWLLSAAPFVQQLRASTAVLGNN